MSESSAQMRLRLTRRGRVVIGAMLTLLVAGLFVLVATLNSTEAAASSEGADVEFGYVVVQPGESLWSVAVSLDPTSDPRDVIADIVRLNGLDDSGVLAGQAIAVPLHLSEAPGVLRAEQVGL